MAVCSVHGKTRSMSVLTDDGSGGFMCTPGAQCKVSGGGGGLGVGGVKRPAAGGWAGGSDWMELMGMMGCGGGWGGGGSAWGGGGGPAKKQKGGGGVTCSVHIKNRSMQSLMDDGMGGYMCQPGMECQIGAKDGGDQGSSVCSIHNKKRSQQNLIDDGMGGYQCMPGNECQIGAAGDTSGATEQVLCSTHGKNRSMQSCEDDGMGGYKCRDGFECKTGDSMPSKGGCKGWGKQGMGMGGMQGGMVPVSAIPMIMQAMKGKGKGMMKGKAKGMMSMGW